jgi:hypothetical protein
MAGQSNMAGRARAITPLRAPDFGGRLVSFCSHCGERPADAAVSSRVCSSCQLGLMLMAGADEAPAPGGSFLVVDGALSVCAVSKAAETLLATSETDAVNRHITELLVLADTETQGLSNLAVAVSWAARGDEAPRKVFVRPTNTFGVRLVARIASCGPRRAALVVFE